MTIFLKSTRLDGTDFYSGQVDYASALASGEPLPELSGDVEFPGPGWYHLATVPTECVGMSWPCRLFEVEPVGDVCMDTAHPHKIGARSVRVLREIEAHRVFGPQGEQVAAFIERCATLTEDDVARLDAAWDAAWNATWDAAWKAAWNATRDAAWGTSWNATRDAAWKAAWNATRDAAWGTSWGATWDAAWKAAWNATRDAAWGTSWGATWDATWDAAWKATRDAAWGTSWGATWGAAWALLVRDLIGQHPGWDQAAYDALTGPWRRTIGPIHPDDAPMSDYLRGRIDKQERIRNVMAGER